MTLLLNFKEPTQIWNVCVLCKPSNGTACVAAAAALCASHRGHQHVLAVAILVVVCMTQTHTNFVHSNPSLTHCFVNHFLQKIPIAIF
jgi:hypothetical protein